MSTDLLRYTPPNADEWGQLIQLSEMIAPAPFVPDALRGKPGSVMGCMMMGRELGIGPMQSVNDISFIKGKRTLAATLMVQLVRARGHKFKTVESNDAHAVVQIHRKGEAEPEPPVEFTWADAQRAKLTDGDNYKKYPVAMLWSRATSAACRRDASECLGGNAYTAEELDSIDEQDPVSTTAMWGEPAQESGGVGERGAAQAGREVAADSATIQAGPGGGRREGVRNVQAPAANSSGPGHFPRPGPDRTSGRSGSGAAASLAGNSVDPAATPSGRTETPAAGLGSPGPVAGPAPDGSGPPGSSGDPSPDPEQVRTGPAPGSGANEESSSLGLFRSICKTYGIKGTRAIELLNDNGWALPVKWQEWQQVVAGWSHTQVMSAANTLEKALEAEFNSAEPQDAA
jgi:hypothetical protein